MPASNLPAAPALRASFLRHPRRIWWRGWLFQVHLWVGLLLTLYICVVGISGSILVFQNELYSLARPALFSPLSPAPADLADRIPRYLETVRQLFPGVHFSSVYLPGEDQAIVQLEGEPQHPSEFNEYLLVYLDPASGRILGTTDSHFWVAWLRELHVRLLAGRTGAVINGSGAACLLILTLTGIFIWWPGLKHWSRGLKVDLRRRMVRINFDLHSAIGFWSVLFVLIWGVSGVYFSWPGQFVSALDFLTPAKGAAYPSFHVAPQSGGQAGLLKMIADARSAAPGFHLVAVNLPETNSDALSVVVSKTGQLDLSTYFFYNPFSGQRLGVWERGPGPTLGTKIVYWLGPLHFGQSWGVIVKTVWFVLGLSLPALAVTGVFMYWNRYLRKRIRKWTEAAKAPPGSLRGQ